MKRDRVYANDSKPIYGVHRRPIYAIDSKPKGFFVGHPDLYIVELFSAISIVDIFFAGLLGPAAQAALGIADQIVFLNMLVMNGFCAGVNTRVSQACGASKYALVAQYMKHGILASALVGVAATVLGYCSADAIANVFASDKGVAQQAASFIRLCALGNLPWALVVCQGAIFRASSRAAFSVTQWLIVAVLCIGGELISFFVLPGGRSLTPLALCWDLAITAGCLSGLGPLREVWKGPGASVASSRSELKSEPNSNLDFILNEDPYSNLRFILNDDSDSNLGFNLNLFVEHIGSILAVGIPVMLGEMCWLLSNLFLFSLLSLLPHATSAQAAWTIHLKIEETIAYVPLLACCQATASLVGNYWGAGNRQEARRITCQIAALSALIMLALGCATAWVAPYVVQGASADGEVRLMAQQLLMGSIITFPVNAISLVLAASLEGAGATMLPMLVNVFALVVVRLPLAWVFAMPLGCGVVGAWTAKCLSNLIGVCGMIHIFRRQAPKFDWHCLLYCLNRPVANRLP